MREVDHLLAAPPRMAGLSIEALGESTARTFLRFYSSELNRWYFDIWEIVQMVLGVCLIATLAAGGNRRRSTIVLCSLMLVMVLILHFAIAPELNRLGRVLDFFPAHRYTADRGRYFNFRTAYMVVEALKVLFGMMLLSSLLRMHEKRSKTADEQPRWVKAR
jgi:predicted MFS family arabinose efflux permease